MVFTKNPLIRPAPKKFIGKGGHKSAGILDDFAVRKNVATKEGTCEKTPVNDNDIANKKYVDDTAGGGGVDWTLDQSPAVINAANYVDNNTTYVAGDFAHNSLSGLNDGTDYEHITAAQVAALHAETHALNSHTQGSNKIFMTKGAAFTEIGIGDAGKVLTSGGEDEDLTWETNVSNVTTNITVVEAPTNVEIQSSDGSNDTIAAADETNAGVMTTSMYDEHVLAVAHYGDNTQAHTDYLINNGDDTTTGLLSMSGATITTDTTISGASLVRNILIGTEATPPTASTVTQGTLYVQYTA